MENEYQSFATVFSNEADWSIVLPTLLIATDPNNVDSNDKVLKLL